MEQLILLGQVPGTSIHITFVGWLIAASVLSLIAGLYYDFSHQRRLWFAAVAASMRLGRRRYLKHLDQIAL